MASDCPSEATLVRFSDGELDDAAVARLTAHLVDCFECRELLALAAAVDGPGPHAATPTSVGRYRLVGVLGAGAMGVVHAAEDPQLGRAVAIKIVHRADERLVDEARAMASVSHPNVVPVFDVGEADGRTYIVMEKVDGSDLRRWSRGRSWRELVACFIRCGRGLAAAHAAGLVHRDFKPSNVLVDAGGCPKVTDFGLVGVAQESIGAQSQPVGASAPVRTRAGVIVGTPAYMSPEQFRVGELTAATDQFSLCIALVEALCGERPTKGRTVAELAASAATASTRVASLCPDAPGSLAETLRRGLAPRPQDRFPSMCALVESLERAVQGASPARRHWSRTLAVVIGVCAGGWLLVGPRVGAEHSAKERAVDDRPPLFLRPEVARLDAVLRAVEAEASEADFDEAARLLEREAHALEAIGWAPTWVDGQLLWASCARVRGDREARRARLRRAHYRAAAEGLDRRAAQAATGLIAFHATGAGDAAAAEHWFDVAVGAARRVDDPMLEAEAALRAAYAALVASRYDDALELANRASTLFGDPADPRVEEHLAELDGIRGFVGLYQGDISAARGAFSSQLQRLDARVGPLHPKRAPVLLGLIQVALAERSWDEAERLLDARRAVVISAFGRDSVPYGRNLAQRSRLAEGRGDVATALRKTQEARETFVQALGAHHPDVARQHARIGDLHARFGSFDEAQRAYTRALDECIEFSGEASYCAVAGHANLGLAQLQLAQDEEASRHLRVALTLAPDVLGPRHAVRTRAAVGLAETLLRAGAYEEARALLRSVLGRAWGPDEAETQGRAAFAMARALLEGPDPDAAELGEARQRVRQALEALTSSSMDLEAAQVRAWAAGVDV